MNFGQWALWGVCVALLGALAVLARGPVRLLFGAGFVADVVAKAGHVLVLFDAPKPLSVAWITGALSWHERAAYHVDTALASLWPFGCCALAWWAFCGPRKANGPDESEPLGKGSMGGVEVQQRSPREGRDGQMPGTRSMALGSPAVKPQKANGPGETEPPQSESYTGVGDGSDSRVSMPLGSIAVKVILVAWLAFSAGMALAFPLPRGWTAPILHAVYLACAALSGLAIMLGWSRRREPDAVVASWLFAGQAAVSIVGPFVRAPWEPGGWDVARVGYITLFSLLLVRFVRLRPRR